MERSPHPVSRLPIAVLACSVACFASIQGSAAAVSTTKKPKTSLTGAPSVTIPTAKHGDRLSPVSLSHLPGVALRRSANSMIGSHQVVSTLTFVPTGGKIEFKGQIDPATGTASLKYRESDSQDLSGSDTIELLIKESKAFTKAPDEFVRQYGEWISDDLDSSEELNSAVLATWVIGAPTLALLTATWTSKQTTDFGAKTSKISGKISTEEAFPGLAENFDAKISYSGWVDTAGRLRRVDWELQAKKSSPVEIRTIRVSTTFRDLHKTLKVNAPTKDVISRSVLNSLLDQEAASEVPA